MGPAYHPDWLVSFWLSTPGLNWLNPHYLLIILAAVFVLRYFIKRGTENQSEPPDTEDVRFKHFLLRKKVIEEQMAGLEVKRKAAEITEEDFLRKLKDYQNQLEQVKNELQQYTL
jgi:hypothetical protein